MCRVKENGTTTAKDFSIWRFCLPCPSCSLLLCNFHSQEPVLYKASASAPGEVFQSTSSEDWLRTALLLHPDSYPDSYTDASTLFTFLSAACVVPSCPWIRRPHPAFRTFKCRTKPQSSSNTVILPSAKVNNQVTKSKKEFPRGMEHGWSDRHN